MVSDYRLSPALAARMLGVSLVLLGVLVFVLTVLVDLWGLSGSLVPAIFAAGVLAVAGLGFWFTRKAYVVRFTDTGYRVRFVRGAGVKQGRWKDVEDAVTRTLADSPVVVLRLRNGSATTIPVEVLGINREKFVRELQEHLQRGHGLRRLNG
ncbi:hypothetical protein [Nocardioides limicola]|uniref:hypothetical protein n=1 Tax=Nocardioides limicola TaxID=2803368 RepID=UPI00193C523F|nr:hypothetical protein [Nocardioides sp. DJM-14]